MPDSDIAKLVLAHRNALLDREAVAMREMTRRWLQIERALEAEMLKTVTELGGETLVTEAMILRNTRFQKLLWQARAEYGKFADYVEERVSDLQEEALKKGIEDAYTVLGSSLEAAGLSITFDKLPIGAIENMIGLTADGTPLKTLLMDSYGEAVNGIIEEMLTGLAKGLNPTDIAELMANKFGVGLDRALTIARTEQARAYRTASLEQYRDSGVVMQYKRMAKKDDTTCLGCLFADGEIYDTEHEFDEHPNGRCSIIPVVRGAPEPTWQTGKEWFASLSADRQQSILGDKRFDLWQNGTPLDAMTKLVNDPTWGGSFVPTPLSDL